MNPVRRHIYRRVNADKTCTGYLVERFTGKLVGRITPIGEIPSEADDLEIFIQEKADVSLSGKWLETKKKNLHKIRCVLGVNYESDH